MRNQRKYEDPSTCFSVSTLLCVLFIFRFVVEPYKISFSLVRRWIHQIIFCLSVRHLSLVVLVLLIHASAPFIVTGKTHWFYILDISEFGVFDFNMYPNCQNAYHADFILLLISSLINDVFSCWYLMSQIYIAIHVIQTHSFYFNVNSNSYVCHYFCSLIVICKSQVAEGYAIELHSFWWIVDLMKGIFQYINK